MAVSERGLLHHMRSLYSDMIDQQTNQADDMIEKFGEAVAIHIHGRGVRRDITPSISDSIQRKINQSMETDLAVEGDQKTPSFRVEPVSPGTPVVEQTQQDLSVDSMTNAILEREGGWSDRSGDKPTMYGVTLDTFRAVRGDQSLTKEDLRNISVDEAREIYKEEFYRRPKIDKLPSQLQPFVFDMSINHGMGKSYSSAGVQLQKALAGLGYDPGKIDGLIGPNTIKAAERAAKEDIGSLLRALATIREQTYYEIVRRNPEKQKFLKGWLTHRVDGLFGEFSPRGVSLNQNLDEEPVTLGRPGYTEEPWRGTF